MSLRKETQNCSSVDSYQSVLISVETLVKPSSAPDVESKDRLPDRLGKDSTDTVANNIEVEDSVDTTKRGKANIWLPKVWDRSSPQIKASNIELEKIDNNPSCKAMNQPSILQDGWLIHRLATGIVIYLF